MTVDVTNALHPDTVLLEELERHLAASRIPSCDELATPAEVTPDRPEPWMAEGEHGDGRPLIGCWPIGWVAARAR